MDSWNTLNMVMSQQGNLTLNQYLDIYDHSSTLQCVFFNEDGQYQYEMSFIDKVEPILFNIKSE